MDADSVFESLASPVRRDILAFLAEYDERNAGDIADAISGVGRTAVSTHLRILKAAGLIRERRDGRQRLYALDRQGSAMIAIGYFQGLMSGTLAHVDANAQGSTVGAVIATLGRAAG